MEILTIMVFTCANRDCQCLKEGVGIYFFTNDINKAEEHSRLNNSPMSISRMSIEEFLGQKQSVQKLKDCVEKK